MRSAVPTLRPLTCGVLVAGLVLAGTVLLPSLEPAPRPAPAADRTGGIAILRDWDRHRAAAWRTGGLRALGELYVAGSRAGRADRAMLAAYVERGLRVRGARMQVASVDVERADDDRVVLLVTDRLSATAAATGPRGVLRLPRDRWSSRRIVLVHRDERWQVARVTAQPRPAATTAETSGSENS